MAFFKYGLITLIVSFGTAHACTLPKSHYKHVSCTARTGVFIASKDDGSPVALLDKKGNKTANLFAYQAVLASEFKSGLLPAQKNGKVGYINDQGKVVIGFDYEPMAGKTWARGAYDGRIIIKQQGALGVIDTKGNVVVMPNRNFSSISDFKDGKATIKDKRSSYQISKDGAPLGNNPASVISATPTNKTHAKIMPKNLMPRQQDGKWGFVDEIGTPMIVYTFDEVRPYSEGLAAVRTANYWGFIDMGGNLVIDFRFDKNGFVLTSTDAPELPEPLFFHNGKAWIGSLHDGKKLCINTQGVNISC